MVAFHVLSDNNFRFHSALLVLQPFRKTLTSTTFFFLFDVDTCLWRI